MRIKLLFLFAVIIPICSLAQHREPVLPSNPAIEYYKQQLSQQVMSRLNKIDWNHIERKTDGGMAIYTVPVVVHVLHEYGTELVPDNTIYNLIDGMNTLFLKTNPDTINIIDKFKPVAANTQIGFKLATIDPNGNQTKGVEHIFTYLTYLNNDFPDQSKINQWPQENYLNIWIVNTPPYNNSGYYYTPFQASYQPYYDGLVVDYDIYYSWLSRLTARCLNLPYPCDCCDPFCNDADGIPDTPPCGGAVYYVCSNIYDSTCDTPNGQNIMINKDSCGIMFTYGQGQYMQYVLQIDIGNRDSLVTPTNFSNTGMDQPMPDMLPVADFSVKNIYNDLTWFFCENKNVRFTNESWNDTITGVSWTFSNSPAIAASSSDFLNNTFSQPGWVTVSLAATGNNTGTTTLTNTQALYIADTTPTNGYGYYQEFNAGGDLDKWPILNYFSTGFNWQLANVGCYDNTSVEFTSFDGRTFPANMTGTPAGSYSDLFTPVFDLIGFSGACYLNFMSSGATATSIPKAMNDTLEIDYSVDLANTWHLLKTITGDTLDNKGTIATPYTPGNTSDWVPQAIPVPLSIQTRHTIFRFRYHPGADSAGFSTGNNFYLDRFNLNAIPAATQVINQMGNGLTLQPNPTNGAATVIIKDESGFFVATIIVSDITGRVVYERNCNSVGNTANFEIPAETIKIKGLYLVHVTTGSFNQTEKLIVY